jgi:hypothetical protein
LENRKFANRQNVCYVKHALPVKLLFLLGLGVAGAPPFDR